MWFISNKHQVFFIVVLSASCVIVRCDAISNTNFNSHIRDYSTADVNNITNIKTLQKEESEKYATFTSAANPIKFKEIPDSALSSTSNGRGFYHDQPGYALGDYDYSAHYAHGHDYHLYDPHPDPHAPHGYDHDHHNHHDHHDPHGHDHHYSGHHHVDHGHYKHYKHALAAKTVLWPIAGLAILGAAAALVSNPVLLQLGVVSGKRRRRDTEEITGPEFTSETLAKYAEKIKKQNNEEKIIQFKNNFKTNANLNKESLNDNFKRRILKTNNSKDVKNNVGIRKVRSSVKRNVDQVTPNPDSNNSNNDDDKFIPIPIKLRTPHVSD